MSRCLRKMPHRKNYELESGKFTRKSVRLNNVKENLKTYPVITRNSRGFICCGIFNSKLEESSVTDVSTNDQKKISSGKSIVKNLTYSSSDSNSSNDKVKNKKILSCKSFDQNQMLDKKKINGGQRNRKAHPTESWKVYNLRRRASPLMSKNDSETLKSGKRSSSLRRTSQLEESHDKTPNNALSSAANNQSNNLRSTPKFEESKYKTPNNVALSSVTSKNSYSLRRSPRFAESESKTLSNATVGGVTNKRSYKSRSPQLQEVGSETSNNAVLCSVTNKRTSYIPRRSPRFAESESKTLSNAALGGETNKRSYKSRSPQLQENGSETSNNAVLCSATNKESYIPRRSPRFEESEDKTLNNDCLSGATSKGSCKSRNPRFEVSDSETSTKAVLSSATKKESFHDTRSPRSEESNNTTAKNVVMRSVTKKRRYSLRSPRFAEKSGEILNAGVEKITKKKAQKTKAKARKNENVRKPSGSDVQFKEPRTYTLSFSNSNKEEDVKEPKVRKTGPMARKRELRAMLEKQDEGYEDDAFEGTPFRNRKSLLKCELSPVVLDTSLQSISTDTELRTPYIFKTPVNRLRPAGPLPSATSDSDTMTPGLLNSFNRNHVDCYVNKLKRRKIHLVCNKKMKSNTPLSKKPSRIFQSNSCDFNCNTNYGLQDSESENCEDADYYWSDTE